MQPPSGPRSKKSTLTPVSVPPGLSMPQDFPPLAAPQTMPTPLKSQRKATIPGTTASSIKPAVPSSIQSQQSKGTGNEKQKRTEDNFTVDSKPAASATHSTPDSVRNFRNKKESSDSGTTSHTRTKRQEKRSEATDAATRESSEHVNDNKKTVIEGSKATKTSDARQRPGKLDIAAAKNTSIALEPIDTATSSKKAADSKDRIVSSSKPPSAVSQPETPATAVSQTSSATTTKQGQPRTIRVLSSADAQSRPSSSAAISFKQPSRQGSLSSINMPGTPVSERISDNVSLTSASMSRANSPPPSKVGTAPARHVSKSQQKKERQARAKQVDEVTKSDALPIREVAEEPVQAPIIGRKKKTKKATTRATADSTPAGTRPSSPTLDEGEMPEKEPSPPATPSQEGKKGERSAPPDSKELEQPFSPSTPTSSDQQTQKSALAASAIFSGLQSANAISPLSTEIFRSVPGLNYRFELDALFPSLDTELPSFEPPDLSDAQIEQLESGEAICVEQLQGTSSSNRLSGFVVVLPDRRTLRGLTRDQAQRYTELRREALETSALLHRAGHGPPPPKPLPRILPTGTKRGGQLQNRFVGGALDSAIDSTTNPPQQAATITVAATSATSTITRLPQPFAFSGGSNNTTSASETGHAYGFPPTHVDDAAAFVTTRRGGGGTMTVEEAEGQLGTSRKETEGLEKRLVGLLRRNRRLVFGGNG